ncbi:MAG: DUF3243 domain-containing protein, partial [Bacillota bacterium]
EGGKGLDLNMGWDQWKETLAKAVRAGERAGLGHDSLVNQAEQIGDFLENKVDPATPEQAVLRDLWRAADESEQKAIASALIKLVQR